MRFALTTFIILHAFLAYCQSNANDEVLLLEASAKKIEHINSAEVRFTYKEKASLDIDIDETDTLTNYYNAQLINNNQLTLFDCTVSNGNFFTFDGDTLLLKKKNLIFKSRVNSFEEMNYTTHTLLYNAYTNAMYLNNIIEKASLYEIEKEADTLINKSLCSKIKILKKGNSNDSLYFPSFLCYLYISYSDSLVRARHIFKRNYGFDFYWKSELIELKINTLNTNEFKSLLSKKIKMIEPSPLDTSFQNKVTKRVRKKLLTVGDSAVNWKLPLFNDTTKYIELYAIQSRYTLIDFWYASCTPCLQAIPKLKIIRNLVNSDTLTIIGLNPIDTDVKRIFAINQKFNFNYPIVFKGKSVANDYGIDGYPQLLLIDNKTKKIVFTLDGYSENMHTRLFDFLNQNN